MTHFRKYRECRTGENRLWEHKPMWTGTLQGSWCFFKGADKCLGKIKMSIILLHCLRKGPQLQSCCFEGPPIQRGCFYKCIPFLFKKENPNSVICLAWNPLHIPTNYFLFSPLFATIKQSPCLSPLLPPLSLFNEEVQRVCSLQWIEDRHLGVMNFKVIIFFQLFGTMGISFWLSFTALRGPQISHIPIRLESDQSCVGPHQGLSQKDKEQMANTELSSPFQTPMEGHVGKPSPSIAHWLLNRTTTCHQPVGMNLC